MSSFNTAFCSQVTSNLVTKTAFLGVELIYLSEKLQFSQVTVWVGAVLFFFFFCFCYFEDMNYY